MARGNAGISRYAPRDVILNSCYLGYFRQILRLCGADYLSICIEMGCRPRWLVVEMVYAQSALRASQTGYRTYSRDAADFIVPSHAAILTNDLLRLALHRYDVVRT